MKRVSRIQTSDGALHESERDAKRHAERRYGDALLRHGRALTHQKYTTVTDYLDANLDELVELQALKKDMEMEPGHDDDD